MSSRLLELAIQSIQNQQLEEGARLIRIALRAPMPDALRAIAYVWLAQTTTDAALRLQYYRQAHDHDPANTDIHRRMSALLASQLPAPPAAQAAPAPMLSPAAVPVTSQSLPLPDVFSGQPPLDLPEVQYVVGISGGPHGVGAGVIIHPQGIVATTRQVVGMNLLLDVFLPTGPAMRGQVLRAYPLYDLAFVRINVFARQLAPTAAPGTAPANTQLSVLNHLGQATPAALLPMWDIIAPHWFPTTLVQLPDAGGCPVYEAHGRLLGLLTDNSFRDSRQRFGLHIAAILNLLSMYAAELQQALPHALAYCPTCGHGSRAHHLGAFYCEVCGAVLPQFAQHARYPQAAQLTTIVYHEHHPPCPRCGARVGYYRGRCLRCEVIST